MQAASAFLGHAAFSAVTRRQCLSLQLVPAAAQGSRRRWGSEIFVRLQQCAAPALAALASRDACYTDRIASNLKKVTALCVSHKSGWIPVTETAKAANKSTRPIRIFLVKRPLGPVCKIEMLPAVHRSCMLGC